MDLSNKPNTPQMVEMGSTEEKKEKDPNERVSIRRKEKERERENERESERKIGNIKQKHR